MGERVAPTVADVLEAGGANRRSPGGSALRERLRERRAGSQLYAAEGPLARPDFHEAEPLEDEDVSGPVRRIRDRILRLLRRRDLWPRPGEEDAAESPASPPPRSRVARRSGPTPARAWTASALSSGRAPPPGALCASLDGFSLHAQVHVPADDRVRLEHLVRYVCRPALPSERLSIDERGRVLLELRHPWRDGTTHIVFEPLVFLERLAAGSSP